MFKFNVSIPGRESVEIDKEFLDTIIIPNLALTGVSKSTVLTSCEQVTDVLQMNAQSLREELVSPKEAYEVFKKEIYFQAARLQFEDYVENLHAKPNKV